MPVNRVRSASDCSRNPCISSSTSSYFFFPTVRLATILINAAPIAPMIAAALPPPGVDALEASWSRKVCNCCSVNMGVTSLQVSVL